MASVADLLEHKSFKTLNQEQVESFMKHGFLRLPGAISKEVCEEYTKNVWIRLGMDPTDKSTWTKERINMPKHRMTSAKDLTSTAYAAICEIVGGENRLHEGAKLWSDGFIVNLGSEETEGKAIPPKELDNWHVDGDFFIHFLDSPEQALLVIPCWSDVEPNAGATWICSEGPKRIGKWLYDHPEGVTPRMSPRGTTMFTEHELKKYIQEIKEAPDETFFEMTGKQGDVILMHPLTLHSASKNGRRLIRIITNPPVALNSPFVFNREDPSEYSLVELKTIQDVGGLEKFKDWKITGEREYLMPKMATAKEKMLEEENERLRKRGLMTSDPNLHQGSHMQPRVAQVGVSA